MHSYLYIVADIIRLEMDIGITGGKEEAIERVARYVALIRGSTRCPHYWMILFSAMLHLYYTVCTLHWIAISF